MENAILRQWLSEGGTVITNFDSKEEAKKFAKENNLHMKPSTKSNPWYVETKNDFETSIVSYFYSGQLQMHWPKVITKEQWISENK